MLVGHASVDEEEVEPPSREPFIQSVTLSGNVDVEVFDLEAPAGRFRQLVECRAIRTADGGYDPPNPERGTAPPSPDPSPERRR